MAVECRAGFLATGDVRYAWGLADCEEEARRLELERAGGEWPPAEPGPMDPSRMTAPTAPGHLSHGNLRLQLVKPRPCPRCGGNVAPRVHLALCAACKVDPEYLAYVRRRKNRGKRESRERAKNGAKLPAGRPKTVTGVWG